MAVDTIEKAIYYILANDAGVEPLVSTRIFPLAVPQVVTTLPAIVYEQTTGPREHTMDGPVGMMNPLYEITCWASTYGGARALADKARIAIDGNRGTTGTVVIAGAFLHNETDLIEQSSDIRATRRYGKRLSLSIWVKEATS